MRKLIKITAILLPIGLISLIIFLIITNKSDSFDNWFYAEIIKIISPSLTQIMKFITHMGDAIFVITICLIFFVIPKLRKGYAIPISISVISSTILNVFLKNIFVRERPDILRLINETSYSFPSGHSMNNMALYSMIIILVYKKVENNWLKYSIITYSTLITLLIGFSRVYLGVHYITDVIGGWGIGLLITIVIYYGWQKVIKTK